MHSCTSKMDNQNTPSNQEVIPVKGTNFLEGVFDLMHSGHVNIISAAKKISDVLIVGVNPDEEVKLAKGALPIFTHDERVKIVNSLIYTDGIEENVPYYLSVQKFLSYGYDNICHGSDLVISPSTGESTYSKMKDIGRYLELPRTQGISTSALIYRLVQGSIRMHDEDEFATTWWETMIGSPFQVNDLLDYKKEGDKALFADMLRHIKKECINSIVDDWGRIPTFPQQTVVRSSHIADILKKRKKTDEDTVVYVDGAFDVIHSGTVEIIEEARKHGTWVIVGLFDDALITDLRGSNFPILSMMERAIVLMAIKGVDEVIFGAPWDLDPMFLSIVDPKVIIKREELLTRSGTSALRIRAAYDAHPYETAMRRGIPIISPEPSMVISDLYVRIYGRRKEILENIQGRLIKESTYYPSDAEPSTCPTDPVNNCI